MCLHIPFRISIEKGPTKADKTERGEAAVEWGGWKLSCGSRCLTGIDFSSLWPWDWEPQIQRNHFAGGVRLGKLASGSVGAPAERSGRARPGREWAGPGRSDWGHMLRPPPCLRQALHWIISLQRLCQTPCAQGEVSVHNRGAAPERSLPLHFCISQTQTQILVCTLNTQADFKLGFAHLNNFNVSSVG